MQGILDLEDRRKNYIDDFIVSYSNFEAYNTIGNLEKWQNQRFLIIAPPKSGKTLLAKIWQKNVGAVFIKDSKNMQDAGGIVVDNLEGISEINLVSIINFANEKSLPLLLTASTYPIFELKDLNSRIKATYKSVVKQPDEELLKLLMIKLFKDKQIEISKEVISFIFLNMERSYEFAYEVVQLIDKLSKIEKRKITRAFVSEILMQYYKINVA
jgi:chromosomal replication initiation ATPase DnaA